MENTKKKKKKKKGTATGFGSKPVTSLANQKPFREWLYSAV